MIDAANRMWKFRLECKNVTFWQALDTIADAANAQIDLYTTDGKLALKKGSGKAKTKDAQTVSYDGLFRTSIKQIMASIDPESGQTTYKAGLEVAWEPTLQPFFLETRPQNLSIKDAPVPLDLGKAEAPVDGRNALFFETPIPSLPREMKKIAHMEGKLSIIAPRSMLLFSFKPPLDQLKEQLETVMLAGVECEISQIRLGTSHWTVKVKSTIRRATRSSTAINRGSSTTNSYSNRSTARSTSQRPATFSTPPRRVADRRPTTSRTIRKRIVFAASRRSGN